MSEEKLKAWGIISEYYAGLAKASQTALEQIKKTCIIVNKKDYDSLQKQRDDLLKALVIIAAGTEDEEYPFRAIDREQMKYVARKAISEAKK